MASIDKIYGTNEQWNELFRWLARHRPQYCKFLYPPFGYDPLDRPISSFPSYADKWLMKNCQLKFVQDRLKEQYRNDPYDNILV